MCTKKWHKEKPRFTKKEKINMLGILYAIISNLAYSFTGPLVKMVFKHNNSIKIFHILYWQALFGLFLYYLAGKIFGVYVLGVP